MTITNKLRLSFAIFVCSLLIPVFVGIKAISAIREYQQLMQDISDLNFTQMKMAGAVGEVMSVNDLQALAEHETHIKGIQALFNAQVKPLTKITDKAYQEYLQTIIEDEKNLGELAFKLFDIRRNFLTSSVELKQKLAEHHTTPEGFLEMVNTADDKLIIEALVDINNKSSYALYNGMKESDVQLWLEALAALKEKLLHNTKLSGFTEMIEREMKQRRDFVLSMVETARAHQGFEAQEERLILTFINTVERNIQHGQHAKKQLMTSIKITSEQTTMLKGAVLALMLIIAVAISIYLTRSIANSITNMKRAVERVGKGDLDHVMQEQGKNEFSSLADAFNQMTAEIKQAREDMSNYNQQLEARIDERTVELKAAVEKVEQNNRQLEKLSAQLSKYLSPQLFQSIFSGQKDVVLDTSRKKLTVFFSDIQGFTQMTDTMDPEAMTMVLNTYLNAMTEIALQYGGTIDKFIGDAVMVFFGDPETQGDQQDAIECVQMALAMREKMAELKQYWQEHGYKLSFHIRMGINTGYCTVGNFGAENRMDYTIVGGNVNLASRLESTAEADQIQISRTTQELVKDVVECQLLGEITVKGIAKPIQTYQVIGRKPSPTRNNHIQRTQPGLDVDLDLAKIDREEAKAQLLAIIKSLES